MEIKKEKTKKISTVFYMFSLLAGIAGITISDNYFSGIIDGYVDVYFLKYILMFMMGLCIALKFYKADEKYYYVATSAMMQILLGTVLYLMWLNDFEMQILFTYIVILIVVIPFQYTSRMMVSTCLVWIFAAAYVYYNVASPAVGMAFFLFFLVFPTLLILAVSLENKGKSIRLEKLAFYDTLTDLPNRKYMRHLVEKMMEEEQAFGFLFIDLDNFKEINDLFGHSEGDRILKSVAYCLNKGVRENDLVGRLCGDEFLIMLSDCEYRQDVESVFARIKRKFDIKIGNEQVAFSVGAVMYPDDASDYDEILKKADIAMYKSKAKGKNQLCFYDDACDFYLYAKGQEA